MNKLSFFRLFTEKTTSRNERNVRSERVRARALRLESLESRELLSVAPGGEFIVADAAATYESGVTTPADVLDFSGATLDGGADQTELNSTSIVVTSELDVVDETDGVVTLREALTDAESGDTITFADSLQGKTIALDSTLGELRVNQSLTIDASNLWDETNSEPGLTISGQGATRILRVIGGSTYIQNHLDVEINVGISGITFTNGYAGDYGGAIRSTGATLLINNCVICDNEATNGGGVSSSYYSNTTFVNCVVTNNSANGLGGAVYSEASTTLSLDNCLISDNKSEDNGGGVYAFQGPTTLASCTVTNNTGKFGGGVFLNGSAPTFNAYNSIIAGNRGWSAGVDFYCDGNSNVRAYHTLSSYTRWSGADNFTYDASQPLFTNATAGDYTLTENSQVIDKGANQIENGDIQYVVASVDLAGNPRVSGGTVDLGAFEYQSVVEQETLATPNGLRETGKTETTITVAWDDVENASGYRLAWKSGTDASYTYVSLEASTTSYTLVDLESGATYEWKVQALGDGINYIDSEYSGPRSVATLLKLSVPSNPSETEKTETTITVAWDTVENANGYQLAWRNENDSEYVYVSLTEATTTSYTIDGLESGETYEWKVQALGDGSIYTDSVYSETLSTTTLLQLEEPILDEALTTDTTITVVWGSVENASGYRLAWKNETDSEYVYVSLVASTTSYMIDGLESCETYEWKVQALGDGIIYADSVYSETNSAATLLKLEEPILGDATLTDTTITVAWDAVENASGYRLAWKSETDSEYVFVMIDEASTTSHTIDGLDSGETYEWKVQALGDGIIYTDSVYSETLSATTLQKLEEPILGDTLPTETTITVEWDAVENASGYRLAWKSENDSEYVYVSLEASTTSHTIDGLDSGETYEWKVQALGDGIIYTDSVYSATSSVATLLKLEEPILSVKTKTETSITVSWEMVENASGYRLAWKSETDSEYVLVTLDASTTSYTLDGLDSGATYEWAVQALGDENSYINSSYSETCSVATPLKLDTPVLLATTKTETTITVAWESVENANGYRLAWKNRTDSSYTYTWIDASTTSYTFADLDSSATYYWSVQTLGDKDAYLNSAFCAPQKVRIADPVQLTAPVPSAVSKTETAITVSWDAVEHASGYRLAWKNKTDSSYTYIQIDPSTTSYTFAELDDSATYYWSVQTLGDKDAYLNSAFCATQKVRIADPVQLTAPIPAATTETETSITVAWEAVENASGYRLAWKNEIAPSYTYVSLDASTTSYTFADLDSSATYRWSVQTLGDKDAYLNSAFCARQTAKLSQTLDASSATLESSAMLDIADELFEELDDEDYDLLAANFII